MALFLIAGVSGAGKSTVHKELIRRGYEAYDTDDHELSAWYDNRTGRQIHRPAGVARDTEWFARHDFLLSPDKVTGFHEKADDHPIFLCGIPQNAPDFVPLFRTIFFLRIDVSLMEQRLLARTNNDFGQTPAELAHIKQWYAPTVERYERLGAVMIDASEPIAVVVDEILSRST